MKYVFLTILTLHSLQCFDTTVVSAQYPDLMYHIHAKEEIEIPLIAKKLDSSFEKNFTNKNWYTENHPLSNQEKGIIRIHIPKVDNVSITATLNRSQLLDYINNYYDNKVHAIKHQSIHTGWQYTQQIFQYMKLDYEKDTLLQAVNNCFQEPTYNQWKQFNKKIAYGSAMALVIMSGYCVKRYYWK